MPPRRILVEFKFITTPSEVVLDISDKQPPPPPPLKGTIRGTRILIEFSYAFISKFLHLPPGQLFAFNCRRFVIIATDSQPPCCISSFLPPTDPLPIAARSPTPSFPFPSPTSARFLSLPPLPLRSSPIPLFPSLVLLAPSSRALVLLFAGASSIYLSPSFSLLHHPSITRPRSTHTIPATFSSVLLSHARMPFLRHSVLL